MYMNVRVFYADFLLPLATTAISIITNNAPTTQYNGLVNHSSVVVVVDVSVVVTSTFGVVS